MTGVGVVEPVEVLMRTSREAVGVLFESQLPAWSFVESGFVAPVIFPTFNTYEDASVEANPDVFDSPVQNASPEKFADTYAVCPHDLICENETAHPIASNLNPTANCSEVQPIIFAFVPVQRNPDEFVLAVSTAVALHPIATLLGPSENPADMATPRLKKRCSCRGERR